MAVLLFLLTACTSDPDVRTSYSGSTSLDTLLTQLDRMILQGDPDCSQRRAKIEAAKDDLATCNTDADRYEVLRGLYSAYRGYRIDSALIVADMRLDMARRLNNHSKSISAAINLAESYANAGDLHKAETILENIDTRRLESHHEKYFYNVLEEIYTRLKKSAVTASDRLYYGKKESAILDTLLHKSDPASTGSRILGVKRLISSGHREEALRHLQQTDTTGLGAPQIYTIGQLCLELGDTASGCPMLARAAILDIDAEVKEYAALIDLASILHSMGQTRRAYRYINTAFDDSRFSGANFRTGEIMKILPVIDSEFYLMEKDAMSRAARQRTLAIIFSIIMLGAALLLLIQARRSRRLSKRLSDLNNALALSNASLREADGIKLGYVSALLQTYAACETSLRDFRRSVYRLLKAGRTDKVTDMVRSEKINTDAFYGIFDSAVISMFPKFIDTVNGIMKNPYVPKSPGALTPELRVIAMIRLDINSIDDIARMLHYSNQTVYNYRSAIRANLSIPEEDFLQKLREI
ncbi:MAG: DUF6377 domain-containing protein [Muribaculaceae bacterium]